MAKTKIKSKIEDQDETALETQGETSDENEVSDEVDEKPRTNVDGSALLAAYMTSDEAVVAAKAAFEAAVRGRSDATREIHKHLGRGPFKYKGIMLGKIAVRGETYFFKGRQSDEIVEIN